MRRHSGRPGATRTGLALGLALLLAATPAVLVVIALVGPIVLGRFRTPHDAKEEVSA
jgi:hypothetical protein